MFNVLKAWKSEQESKEKREEKTNEKDGGKEFEHITRVRDDEVVGNFRESLQPNFRPPLRVNTKRFRATQHDLSTIFDREIPATPASTTFGIFGGESRNAMLRYRVNKSLVKVGLEKARDQSKTCWGKVASTFILR